MENTHDKHPFYGSYILSHSEQDFINSLLRKYKNFPVNDELKKRIYDELQMEKHKGNIKIPFKVILRLDPLHKFPSYVEVILDTKV